MPTRLTWDETKRRSNLAKTVVHTDRDDSARIISFRRASGEEREVYREWLENDET